MKIVFMGTPAFAVPSLERLSREHRIAAVVTAPDKPSGRGLILSASPVKIFAQNAGMPILQPENLDDPAFVEAIRAFDADLGVVVAFRKLPEAVFSAPRLGSINLHASLLPNYRGAAPIEWAVINGETQTGLTTFFIEPTLDTGKILLQTPVPIGENCTAGELREQMQILGAELLSQTLRELEAGKLVPKAQDPALAVRKAPKILPQDCILDFRQPARRVADRIRGLSPEPGARTNIGGKTLKIFFARPTYDFRPGPGRIVVENQKLFIGASDGAVEVTDAQWEGRKRMSAAELVRGSRFGDRADGY
ncbi:MAG: methionyl-tRNA formyltransferase [Bacteroidia bacterium]|nr:methionyl-tRNA formyltransferase [Bacteroidia bacterium]MDW8334688.1 methionyl-tRNA formyltransferase [Bacteroidia bacterium]